MWTTCVSETLSVLCELRGRPAHRRVGGVTVAIAKQDPAAGRISLVAAVRFMDTWACSMPDNDINNISRVFFRRVPVGG